MSGPIHPDSVLEILVSAQKGQKKIDSLKRLHTICRHQYSSGSNDFQLGTVGLLCSKNGLFGPKTLYNKTSEDYKVLITAWSTFAGETRPQQTKEVPLDRFYSRIPDPAVRTLVQSLVHERDKLRSQVNILKSSIVLGLDLKDPEFEMAVKQSRPKVAPLVGNRDPSLSPLEIEALKEAVSGRFLEENDLKESSFGEVIMGNGRVLFRAGFITAIRKVVATFPTS